MVGATGFEPATSWSQTKCSTRLSYAPMRPVSSHTTPVGERHFHAFLLDAPRTSVRFPWYVDARTLCPAEDQPATPRHYGGRSGPGPVPLSQRTRGSYSRPGRRCFGRGL